MAVQIADGVSDNGGYAVVGLTCAIILVAMAGVCALTAIAANALRPFRD